MTEHDICVSLCEYIAYKYPDVWNVTFHIPNEGKRHKNARVLHAGLKAGVPDYFIAMPRGDFAGMFLEIKTTKGKLSNNQKAWIKRFKDQGYCTAVGWGLEDAINKVERYLGL